MNTDLAQPTALAGRAQRLAELVFRKAADRLCAGTAATSGAAQYPLLLTAFLRKAIQTHRAVSLLCRARFAEDAEIILRSTYEMWVAALFIALDPSVRAGHYFAHMPRGFATQVDRILGAMTAFPRVRQALAVDTHALNSDRDALAQAAQQSPHRFRWAKDAEGKPLDLTAMVAEVATHHPDTLPSELHQLAYGNLSMRAHTDPVCLADYFKIGPDGRLSFPPLPGENATHTLFTSGQLLLGLATLLADELHLPEKAALVRVQRAYLHSIPMAASPN